MYFNDIVLLLFLLVLLEHKELGVLLKGPLVHQDRDFKALLRTPKAH